MSCRFIAKAIFNLVPTPSTLETSTGRRYFCVSSANNPPNPPTFPSTSARCVDARSLGRPALTLLPRSISTPACAYAFFFIAGSQQLRLQLFFRQSFTEALHPRSPSFHDVFIRQRIIRHGVVAIIASHAEGVFRQPRGLDHPILGKISQRIGIEIAADLIDRVIRRHEFAPIRKVDPINARVHMGRTTYKHMDFLRTRFFQIVDASFAGRAAHDRVIHNDDAFAFTSSVIRLSFTRTSKSRINCDGWRKLRPT